MHSFRNKHHADELIVGYLKNELSDEQMSELITWIQQSKKNKLYFDECREIWITSNSIENSARYNSVSAFEKFLENTEEETPVFLFSNKTWIQAGKYAAILIVAFFLGGAVFTKFFTNTNDLLSDRYSEIVVPRGAKAQFKLTDGTLVTLNAGSKLRYNNKYGINDRNVELEGEAYFKVAKDKDRPFIVKTSHISVKALGTEFNVKAYPGDKTIETTLVEGSVKVEKLEGKNEYGDIILKPNQKLTFFKSEELQDEKEKFTKEGEIAKNREAAPEKIAPVYELVRENVKVEPLVSWKENRWIIEKEDLSKLAVELERKFDIQILFETDRLKNFRFTGTLLDEPLEQVLKVMSVTAPINYEINGKKVTLKEKENFERIYKKLYNDRNK
jgi:ferric-dicitrate binding protein FerR (iron transport regulator)